MTMPSVTSDRLPHRPVVLAHEVDHQGRARQEGDEGRGPGQPAPAERELLRSLRRLEAHRSGRLDRTGLTGSMLVVIASVYAGVLNGRMLTPG